MGKLPALSGIRAREGSEARSFKNKDFLIYQAKNPSHLRLWLRAKEIGNKLWKEVIDINYSPVVN